MSIKGTIAKARIWFKEYQRGRVDRKIRKLGLQSAKMVKEAGRLNLEAKAIEQNNVAKQAKLKASERLKKAKAEAGSSSMLGAFFSKKVEQKR